MKRFLLILLLLGVCTKRQEIKPPQSAEENFKLAMEEFNNHRYLKAAELFEDCTFKFPGSRHATDAQFYLAECHFLAQNYEKAAAEYEFLIRNFPTSNHYEEAFYKLGLSYFLSSPNPLKDQERTRRAKEILEKFIKNFPESQFLEKAKKCLEDIEEKLARKNYKAFELYLRYDEIESALVYIDFLREQYPDVPSRWKAEWMLAQYYEKRRDYKKAKEFYKKISEEENKFKEKARERLNNLK